MWHFKYIYYMMGTFYIMVHVYDDNDDPLQTSGLGALHVWWLLEYGAMWCWSHVTSRSVGKDCDQDVILWCPVLFQIDESSLKPNTFFNTLLLLPSFQRHKGLYISVSTNVIKLKLCLNLYQKPLRCQSVKYKLQSHT